MTLIQTLQAAREALDHFLRYELRKADMERGKAALAAIDSALSAPPAEEDAIGADPFENGTSIKAMQKIEHTLRRENILLRQAIEKLQFSAPPADEVEVVARALYDHELALEGKPPLKDIAARIRALASSGGEKGE